jgi:hypothetical protein
MGRIGSAYGLIQAIFTILTTVGIGVAAQLVSIQLVVIIGTSIMLLITVTLGILCFQPSKSELYETSISE